MKKQPRGLCRLYTWQIWSPPHAVHKNSNNSVHVRKSLEHVHCRGALVLLFWFYDKFRSPLQQQVLEEPSKVVGCIEWPWQRCWYVGWGTFITWVGTSECAPTKWIMGLRVLHAKEHNGVHSDSERYTPHLVWGNWNLDLLRIPFGVEILVHKWHAMFINICYYIGCVFAGLSA